VKGFSKYRRMAFFFLAFLFCKLVQWKIMKNVNISKTKKDISKRKTPFIWILKGLSNKHELIFIS